MAGGSASNRPQASLYAHCNKLANDRPTGAMMFLSLTIKVQKVDRGPLPGNPCRFPEISETALLLISQ